MRNLRNKTEDHRGMEGRMKQGETRDRDKPEETLNLRKQTEGCQREGGGEGWGSWVMDTG